jgi:hypothetical protein
VQPGPERAAAVEAVQGADRGEERLLGDVLGGGGVVDDQVGGPVGGSPVAAEELLERVLGSVLGLAEEDPLAPPEPRRARRGR